MSKTVHKQLLELAEAIELRGAVVRIKRTGVEKSTRYSITNTGKRANVDKVPEVDVISTLGPLTSDGVREIIAKAYEYGSYEDFLTGETNVKPVKRTPPKKAAPIEVEELELEGDEALELELEDEVEGIEDLEL